MKPEPIQFSWTQIHSLCIFKYTIISVCIWDSCGMNECIWWSTIHHVYWLFNLYFSSFVTNTDWLLTNYLWYLHEAILYMYFSSAWHMRCGANGVQGAVSIRKTVVPGMTIPMLKIRRPNGRLIFNMGIPIPGKDGLFIETGPCWLYNYIFNIRVFMGTTKIPSCLVPAITSDHRYNELYWKHSLKSSRTVTEIGS